MKEQLSASGHSPKSKAQKELAVDGSRHSKCIHGAWPDIVFLPVTSVQSNLQFPSDLLGASLCQMRPVDISDSSRASRYEVGPGLTQACREYNIKPHKCVWTRTDYRPLADHRCATVDLLGDIRLDLRNAIRAVGPGKAITALGKAPRWHLCCNQLAAF